MRFSSGGPCLNPGSADIIDILLSSWTEERLNPFSAYARDFSNAVNGKGLSYVPQKTIRPPQIRCNYGRLTRKKTFFLYTVGMHKKLSFFMKMKTGEKNDPGNEGAAERVEHNLELIKKTFLPCDKVFLCD